jgi:hypothetical protein
MVAASTHYPWLQVLSLLVAALLGLALMALLIGALGEVWRGRQGRAALRTVAKEPTPAWPNWGRDLYFLALVAGPVATAALMFRLRPGVVAPRHLMMIAPPLLILLARAGSGWWGKGAHGGARLLAALRGVTFVAVAVLFVGALILSYRDPTHQRPDVRALARHVESLVGEGDIVVMPYVDYAFNHYYHGAAKVWYVETRVGDVPVLEWFLPLARGARRAVHLHWVHIFADGRELLPWFLQANGAWRGSEWVAERRVSVYDLRSPLAVPALLPTQVRLGPLLLKGAALPTEVSADQRVPVGLWWEAVAPLSSDLKVSVRVLDAGGSLVALDDHVLLDQQSAAPTRLWPPGTQTRSYALPVLPPATAPVSYTVQIALYDSERTYDVLDARGTPVGTTRDLGTFLATAPTRPAAAELPPTAQRVGQELAPGLRLEGYAVDRPTLRPGEAAAVTLYWRATAAPLPDLPVAVRLLSASGAPIGQQDGAPVYGLYPFSRWTVGQYILDRREVRVDQEAAPGAARLEVALGGRPPLELPAPPVDKVDRRFILPSMQYPLDIAFGQVVRLRGYDVERQVSSSGTLRLTLYWEALNPSPLTASYTVFTHLLDGAGQVVAQHDGPPAQGHTLSTTWVKGQIIEDTHELAFKEGGYAGGGTIEVGLYDAKTMVRLNTTSGEDFALLPQAVTVRR